MDNGASVGSNSSQERDVLPKKRRNQSAKEYQDQILYLVLKKRTECENLAKSLKKLEEKPVLTELQMQRVIREKYQRSKYLEVVSQGSDYLEKHGIPVRLFTVEWF